MTHPLTPRDKVARIVDPWAFSIIANITQTERAADNRAKALTKADAIIEAIAPSGDQLSGNPGILKSDDHAELARLADDLRKFEHHAVGSLKIDMGEARRIIAVCDAHIALLAENAALRASVVKANDGFEEYERRFYLEQERATEAERKLAEAVGLLRDLASWFDGSAYNGAWVIRSGDLGVDDAICAARTFLSKEAERG